MKKEALKMCLRAAHDDARAKWTDIMLFGIMFGALLTILIDSALMYLLSPAVVAVLLYACSMYVAVISAIRTKELFDIAASEVCKFDAILPFSPNFFSVAKQLITLEGDRLTADLTKLRGNVVTDFRDASVGVGAQLRLCISGSTVLPTIGTTSPSEWLARQSGFERFCLTWVENRIDKRLREVSVISSKDGPCVKITRVDERILQLYLDDFLCKIQEKDPHIPMNMALENMS